MRDQLLKMCVEGMTEKGLDSPEYKERLKQEVKELQLAVSNSWNRNPKLRDFKSKRHGEIHPKMSLDPSKTVKNHSRKPSRAR